MTAHQIHVKMMVFVLIKKMGTPVAVHQDIADETVKYETMSVCPLHHVKMEQNVLPENSKITPVRVDLAGLESNVTSDSKRDSDLASYKKHVSKVLVRILDP